MSNEILLTVIIGLLLGIALLLGRLVRKQEANLVEVRLSDDIDEVIERFKSSVEHHVDVNAVVGMIKQLNDYPGALEQLHDYPETVRAAAWLHYINTLGSDLQNAQKDLSEAHRIYKSPDSSSIKNAQSQVDSIRAKLDKAVADSGQKVGPRPI